jgi:hypothetical protein
MLDTMPKKKQTSEGDRPPRWMVGLPPVYREKFEALRKRNRRTILAEVTLALEAHLREAGLWTEEDDAARDAEDA